MAADTAAQLVVKLEAKLDKFEKELRKAGVLAGNAVKDIEDKFSKANPTLPVKAMAGALAGFITGFSIDRIIRGLAEANAEMAKLGETAKRVSLDVQRFQELRFAGQRSGVEGKAFDTGIESLAEKLNDSRREETELGKLFAANNVALKDREGNVLAVNVALARVADLVRNAATEFDKIKIAETAGLTREWVPLLEKGADAMAKLGMEAYAAGAVLDRETIAKAKEFEKSWNDAVANFANNARTALLPILNILNELASAAGGLLGKLNNMAAAYSIRLKTEKGATGADLDSAEAAYLRANRPTLNNEGSRLLREFEDANSDAVRERNRAARTGSVDGALPITLKPKRTVIPTKGGGKGGGGEETTDADKAQQRLERYIESLVRQEAVEKALLDTMGQSKAAQQAAVEIAKAQVDLNKLDAETRQTIIDKLRTQVIALEQQREATERARQTQRSLNELAEFGGNAVIDGLEAMIERGESFDDVLKNIGKSFAKMALQAALLGQGPLAALFGLQGSGGGVGGLFGALLGGLKLGGGVGGPLNILAGARAEGGPVRAGRSYLVGEKGIERFTPTTNGFITPNSALRRESSAGASGPPIFNIMVEGATGNTEVRQMIAAGVSAGMQQVISGEASRRAAYEKRVA